MSVTTEADSSNDSEGVGWSWSQIPTVLPTEHWLFHLFPMCVFLPGGNLFTLQRCLCGCALHSTDVWANRRKLDLVFISEKDPDKFHGSLFQKHLNIANCQSPGEDVRN